MKIAPIAGFALALAGILLLQPASQAEQKTAGKKPQETRDKISYALGANIGNNLKRSGELDLNADFVAQGLKDAFTGKTVMNDEEMKATLQSFETEMQAKMMAKHKAAGEKNKAEGEKFLADNAKKEGVVTTKSGLQYKILKEGKGPKPTANDTVTVNYRGTLINGTEFDKSKDPVTFPLEGVIPGWTEALQLMPVGSKWQLFIPANLAYGEQAPPVIGPNQVLLFEVELLGIKPAAKAQASPAKEGQPAEAPAEAPEKK